jgi:ActR/RegA family two-component response regulator
MTHPHTSPVRVSPLSLDEHRQAIITATAAFDQNPYDLVRHYVHAALKHHGNISDAARALNLPRRTVQRILAKRVQ